MAPTCPQHAPNTPPTAEKSCLWCRFGRKALLIQGGIQMTICQIVTAVILATKMDKATGTMPAGAGKAVLAFICLFVAGMLLTPLLLCAHCCCCTLLLYTHYCCVHIAVVCTLLYAHCCCVRVAVVCMLLLYTLLQLHAPCCHDGLITLLLCAHCCCLHVTVVRALLLCACYCCMHIAFIMGSCKCGRTRYSCHRCPVLTGVE